MKIALIRWDGIGDVITTIPLASVIKKHLPDAVTIFVVSSYQAPLLENHPDIDEIHTVKVVNKLPDLDELSGVIERVRPDCVIDVLPRWRTAWLYFRHRIPVRIGTAFRWWSLLYNRRVPLRKHRSEKHEAEYNLELLRPLGIPIEFQPPRLYPRGDEIEAAERLLKDLPHPRIIVHPGSNNTSPNWPKEKYVRLVELLLDGGFSVVLTGSRHEKVKFHGFDRFKRNKRFLNTMGRLTLRQLMGVIKVSDTVFSCGTGIMHIAAALDVPTVSVFGSEPSVSPVRWGPLGNRSKVLTPLENFGPEDGLKAIKEILNL